MPSISMKRPLPCANADSSEHSFDGKEMEVSADVVIDRVKNLIEKKIRNLEKRKTKLEQAQSDLKAGKALTKEQEKAVEYLTEVEIQVNSARDILRSVQQMAIDEHYNKPKVTRDIAVNTIESSDYTIEKGAMLFKMIEMQALLHDMNKDGVRRWFLKPTTGTMQLTNDQMELLDICYHNLCPSREDSMDKEHRKISSQKASVFGIKLLQNSNETLSNKSVTFAELNKLLDDISKCDYLDQGFQSTRSDTMVSDSGVSSVSTLQSPSAGSTQPSPIDRSSATATADVQQEARPPMTSLSAATIPVTLPAVWPLPPPPPVFFPAATAGSFLIDQRQPSLTSGGFFAPAHVPLVALSLPPIAVETTTDSRGYVYDQEAPHFLPFIEQPDFNHQQDDVYYRMHEPTLIDDTASIADNYQPRDLVSDNEYVDISQLSLKSKALNPNAPAFVSRLFPLSSQRLELCQSHTDPANIPMANDSLTTPCLLTMASTEDFLHLNMQTMDNSSNISRPRRTSEATAEPVSTADITDTEANSKLNTAPLGQEHSINEANVVETGTTPQTSPQFARLQVAVENKALLSNT